MSSGVRVNVLQHDIKLNLKPELSKEVNQDLQEEEPIIVQQEPPKTLVSTTSEPPQQKQLQEQPKKQPLNLRNFTVVDPRTKVTNDRLIIPEEQEPVQPEPVQPEPVQQPVQHLHKEEQPVKEVPRSKALFDSSFSLKQMLIYGGLIASGLVLGINLVKSTEQVKHSNQLLR